MRPSLNTTLLCVWLRYTFTNTPWPTIYLTVKSPSKQLSMYNRNRKLYNNFNKHNIFILYTLYRREFGLEKFVPVSLMETMKRKELRKLLTHLLKLNQTMTGTNYKTLTALQAKLYYLTIIAELPSYGAKCFSTNVRVREYHEINF